MRWLLLAPTVLACDPAADDTFGEDLDTPPHDASPAPPAACDGPSAELFYGITPNDVIEPGALLPAVSGGQGGAHVSLGLVVAAPMPEVAWRIDLIDVGTGERIGGVVGETEYAYTALSYWNDETCTGYLPDAKVCLGDCTNESLKCLYDGHTLRAEATTTVVGEHDAGGPTASVEFVLAGGC